MRTCLRVPRVLLPGEDAKWKEFAVIAGDRFSFDRSYWRRVEREAGNLPSALRFMIPEVYAGEDDEARTAAIREEIYTALEGDAIGKLTRGFVFTERETSAGVRCGIVAAIDLECYSDVRGENAPVRPCMLTDAGRVSRLLAVRRASPVEFPTAMAFYRDKRNRTVRSLKGEDLELLYDFRLMGDGGRLRGFFVPAEIADDLVYDLVSGGDPCFAVFDGAEELSAAKRHWEEVKATLTAEEARTHPARFTLTELVNLYDESIALRPVHRMVTGIDKEAFLDFFTHTVKSKREGDYARVLLSGADAAEKTDAAIGGFLAANGGKVEYFAGALDASDRDCAGVLLKAPDKDDIFARIKGGGSMPAHAFRVGEERDARYALEGKEISYD